MGVKMKLISTTEVAEYLGTSKVRVLYIKKKFNIYGVTRKEEGLNHRELWYTPHQFELFKNIAKEMDKKKEYAQREVNQDRIEIIEIGGANKIYEVYQIKNSMPSFVGTVTEDKIKEVKEKLGVK